MKAVDVNLIVYLARSDLPFHQEAVEWFEKRFSTGERIFLFEPILSSAMRILSNRRIFKEPMPSEKMIDFVEALLGQPEVAIVRGGENHWKIFIDLCKKMKAKGDTIPDLYLAALAIEKGATWYSTDRDFAKIPRLQWQHPFEE